MDIPVGRIRVLHVDDSPEFADMTATFLERDDDRFAVETVTSADAGLVRLAEATFDCIVSDYEMSGRNGIEFLLSVRERYPDLPFILFTGKGSEEVASEAISAGATDYLEKRSGTDQYTLLSNRIENAVEQHALQRERERTITRITDAVLRVSSDWQITFVNDQATTLYDMTRAEMLGQSFWEVFADIRTTSLADTYRTVMETREATSLETQTGVLGGWFHIDIYPNPDGGLSFYYNDITERKERERRFRALVEESSDVISIVDADGRFQYQSPSLERILGYDPEETLGDTAWEYIHPDDRGAVMDTFEEWIATPEAEKSIEYRARHADGTWRWFEARAHTQFDNPAVDGYIVNSRDVTERKERERERQRQRDRYRSLFENNPLVIWEEDHSKAKSYLDSIAADVADIETYLLENPAELDRLMERVEIIDINQNAIEYYDAPSKEALMTSLDELFIEETRDVLAAQWAAIANGETRFRAETVSQTLSGDTREELLDVFVPETHADDYSRVYVIGTDITERKERERRLQQQNERLDEFASVVSHDLRNPLSVASARLELAAEECDSPHLQHVADAHERMEHLIEDLLTFARVGSEAIDRKTVALPQLIDECWETLRDDNGSLVVETERQILADRDRLQQLIENLLSNAVDHGGPDVTVRVGDIDEGFYVEDDGPGIPPSDREDVFEAGYSSTSDGVGFGLSIVKQVAEAHGWIVRMTDGSDGGARFEITGVDVPE